jgi:hypothetical protein
MQATQSASVTVSFGRVGVARRDDGATPYRSPGKVAAEYVEGS